MRYKRIKEKKEQENIALERIERLMGLADKEIAGGDLEQANRLIALARRISTKTKTRILKELKGRYCKHCYCYLIPGRTSRTRVNPKQKRVEVTCLKCGGRMYHRINKK